MDNISISYIFVGFIMFMYFVNIISGWKAKASELDALRASKKAIYLPSVSELLYTQRERQAAAFAVAFFSEAKKFVEWFGRKLSFRRAYLALIKTRT